MVISRILFYEKNTDGEFNKNPIRYETEVDTLGEVARSQYEMIWEAIEIEGFDDSEILVEFEVEENGKYITKNRCFVKPHIVRTQEPSRYVKNPRVCRIDREKSRITVK